MHHQHGVARYGGMVKRAIGGVERDYLLLEYRGDDKLYVPSDQIDAVRHYTGGESPTLSAGWAAATGSKAKAKVRSAVAEIAQELVVLYQTRVTRPGHAFAADTPWQRELEEPFPYEETPDQLKAIDDVKADMEADGARWTASCAATSASARPRSPSAPRSRRCRTASRSPCSCPPRCSPSSTSRRSASASPAIPVRVEVLSPLPHHRAGQEGRRRACADGEVDVVIGTHRLLSDDVAFKDLGLLVVDEEQRFGVQPQGADQAAARPTSTCSRSPPRRSRARSR